MPHIRPEIADDLLRRLPGAQAGGGELPESGERIRGKALEHIPQHGGFGKQSGRLQQQRHAALLGRREHTRDQRRHLLNGHIRGLNRLGIRRAGAQAHMRNVQIFGDFQALCNLLHRLRRIRKLADRIDTRDRQSALKQPAAGGRGGVIMKRAVRIGKEPVVYVVQLDPLKAEIVRHLAELIKTALVPPLGGKRQLHCTSSS